MSKRLEIIVEGRVQGVFFRKSTQEVAREAGASGTVRNLPDGRSVEVIVEGSEEQVQAVLDYVRHGPPGADVGEVSTKEAEPEGLSGFEVIR